MSSESVRSFICHVNSQKDIWFLSFLLINPERPVNDDSWCQLNHDQGHDARNTDGWLRQRVMTLQKVDTKVGEHSVWRTRTDRRTNLWTVAAGCAGYGAWRWSKGGNICVTQLEESIAIISIDQGRVVMQNSETYVLLSTSQYNSSVKCYHNT